MNNELLNKMNECISALSKRYSGRCTAETSDIKEIIDIVKNNNTIILYPKILDKDSDKYHLIVNCNTENYHLREEVGECEYIFEVSKVVDGKKRVEKFKYNFKRPLFTGTNDENCEFIYEVLDNISKTANNGNLKVIQTYNHAVNKLLDSNISEEYKNKVA